MENMKKIWDGDGIVFAQVGSKELRFAGKIARDFEAGTIFVQDFVSGRLVELHKDAVRQIIWQKMGDVPKEGV